MLETKYFISNTEEYAKRLERFDKLGKEKRHAPLVNMEMKTILRGINVGLWIIHINAKTGEGELYTDETMRRLLGVADDIAPNECFKHWQNNIDKEHRSTVEKMIHDMAESNAVIQVEYPWHHPQRDTGVMKTDTEPTFVSDLLVWKTDIFIPNSLLTMVFRALPLTAPIFSVCREWLKTERSAQSS